MGQVVALGDGVLQGLKQVMLAKHPAQYLPQSMGSMVHDGSYYLSVNYTEVHFRPLA